MGKGPRQLLRAYKAFDAGVARILATESIACVPGCAGCCRNPEFSVTTDEAEVLFLWLNDHPEVTPGLHGLQCMFLGSDSRCMVYPVRPIACRYYHSTVTCTDMGERPFDSRLASIQALSRRWLRAWLRESQLHPKTLVDFIKEAVAAEEET